MLSSFSMVTPSSSFYGQSYNKDVGVVSQIALQDPLDGFA